MVLECGGKDPMIVFADADLDKAAEDAVTFSLSNCGQVCCAVERIYVDESVKDAFAEKVVKIAGGWTAGDGLDESVTMGPLVSELQRTTVHKHVRAAVAAGATCALGGEMLPWQLSWEAYANWMIAQHSEMRTRDVAPDQIRSGRGVLADGEAGGQGGAGAAHGP